MTMRKSDNESILDEELPLVEPNPHLKRKLRKQHEQSDVTNKIKLPTDLKDKHT